MRTLPLPPLSLVVFDTETTGVVPRVHRVIEFASSEVRDGLVVKEYEQLFAAAAIPPVVEVLTRIKTKDLDGKPAFEDKKDEVLKHIPEDALMVGQNIPFDIGMLKGEGIDISERPWIDTAMLASLVFPELESYSLQYVSGVLKLNHNPPHRALGDVRATLEFLSRSWERMLQLPAAERKILYQIMQKAPEGYRRLFAALPEAKEKTIPSWFSLKPASHANARKEASNKRINELTSSVGTPTLMDESLDPDHLTSVIENAVASGEKVWIAVKALRPTLRRLSKKTIESVTVLHPAHTIADPEAMKRFLAQESFTADEATLAVKISWYLGDAKKERQLRQDLPLHGSEEAVWHGKICGNDETAGFQTQFQNMENVAILEHRDLLRFLEDDTNPGIAAMKGVKVVIDDASMLEDTATKAFGWYIALDDLRAASSGNEILTKLTDTVALWVERTRQFQDIRYLAVPDLTGLEAKGIRALITEALQQKVTHQVQRMLGNLEKILDEQNLAHRIVWIEQKPNGNLLLQSVPEHIGILLQERLFSRMPTTLLIPQGSTAMLPEILPPKGIGKNEERTTNKRINELTIPLFFPEATPLESFLKDPPTGKSIILVPGRKTIDDLYVKYTETIEAKDGTLICQGLNGGLGRMQAEFLAAQAPTVWLLTPWMFESIDLPEGSVDHLAIQTLPFDHPSHPVLGRRSQHYSRAFEEYSLPRVLHRVFRLLRSYARFRTNEGDVMILDDRLRTKGYGKTVIGYLAQFQDEAGGSSRRSPETKPDEGIKKSTGASTFTTKSVNPEKKIESTELKTEVPKKPKGKKDQLSMF